MTRRPLLSGPSWAYPPTWTGHRYECDKCGWSREFTVRRKKPIHCDHDGTQMREVEEVR